MTSPTPAKAESPAKPATRNLMAAAFRELRVPASLAAITCGALAVYAWTAYGSIPAAAASACGYALYCDEPTLSIGERPGGEKVVATFEFRNVSGGPVRILGGKTTCGCLHLEGLPATVAKNATIALDVGIVPSPALAGKPFREGVRLFLDVPSREVECAIEGVVAPLRVEGSSHGS